MLSLAPPPPPPPPSSSNQMILLLSTTSKKAAATTHPAAAVVVGKLIENVNPTTTTRAARASSSSSRRLLPAPQRTNPLIWCAAFCCIIFSLLLILSGVATLIIFLVIKPAKHPFFQVTAASLNSIYVVVDDDDSSYYYLNGDLTFIANLSNPNGKMDISYEYLDIELYFWDKLIGTQAVQPFSQRRGEARLELVHMISSQVPLPLNHSILLRKQVQSNRVRYDIRATFRVRPVLAAAAAISLSHFSYWLHGTCQLLMSGPPNGLLLARTCTTKLHISS